MNRKSLGVGFFWIFLFKGALKVHLMILIGITKFEMCFIDECN